LEFALVLVIGLVAGTVGGIVGFGTSIMLMPVLVLQFGPRQAVPIMAIASLFSNASRVAAWWRELDWRAALAYSATGIPAAALGARTLLVLPPGTVEGVLGVFFIAMIPFRRWMQAQAWRITRGQLAIAGAVIGFITGIVVSTGPLSTPFFLMHGLVKGAFLGTEALGSLAMYISKAITFRTLGALPSKIILEGLIVGSTLIAGSFIGKHFVRQIDAERFKALMDGLLLLAGVVMLWAAVFG
jgi:uncharacterized protein